MPDAPDDEPQEQLPPFRWNWQAMVMVALTMLGLAIPLAGVVWMLQTSRHPASPPPPPTATVATENPALRASLEKAAVRLDVPPIAAEKPVITIAVASEADRAQKTTALRQAVAAKGGTVVEMEPGRRFLVSAPVGTAAAVRLALEGKPATDDSPEDAAGFFEVRFP